MNAVDNITNKIYSSVTLELLDRTNILKEQVKRNSVIGDNSIITGIELFENIIKELNVDSIDDETVQFIEKNVDELLIQIEEKRQIINRYIDYGITCCYIILEGFSRRINNKSYSRKKANSNC